MDMEMMVSMSAATTRSTTVRPRRRRRTPNMIPKKIRTAAMKRKTSAKDFLQMFLERAGDNASGFVRISSLHVEPMDEHRVTLNVHHQRPRRQCNGIRKRQAAKGGLQPGPDPDNAGLDIEARRIDVSHHVDIGAQ